MAQCYQCFRELPKAGKCPHCGYDPASDKDKYPLALRHGTILNGRYILGRVLGQGGFGITYLALDDKTGNRVAIKEYLPTVFAGRTQGSNTVSAYTGELREIFEYGKGLFLQEAKTLAELQGDPHIVRIHSYFEENGTAYFSMEYVAGQPLNKYMREKGGRLSAEEANRLLLPLMESLDGVHAKGIVHRDIAPDNILIQPNGEAKLIDFGAARYSTEEKSHTFDLYDRDYMSNIPVFAPYEQYILRGRKGPFTDVYAMAATYYYAITGKVPPEAVERRDEDTIVPPSTLGVRLSAGTEEALYKALEVKAADRFQTMGEFRRALAREEECWKAESAPAGKKSLPGWAIPALAFLALTVLALAILITAV